MIFVRQYEHLSNVISFEERIKQNEIICFCANMYLLDGENELIK